MDSTPPGRRCRRSCTAHVMHRRLRPDRECVRLPGVLPAPAAVARSIAPPEASPATGRPAHLPPTRPRPARRLAAASRGSGAACARGRSPPTARSCCRLSAHARLRVQSGELLGLPRRGGAPARRAGRGQQHVRRVATTTCSRTPTARRCASGEKLRARKVFHVSPFCEVKGGYASASISAATAGSRASTTTTTAGELLLRRRSPASASRCTRGRLRALLLALPLLTAGVVVRIHWQALKLWVKRVPFFAKPRHPVASTR